MDIEKARKIQRCYEYLRLILAILIIALIVYFSNK